MEVLEVAAFPNIESGGSSPYSFKAAVAMSTSLADLVQSCTVSPFSVPNQVRLASTLTRLRGALQNLDNCCRDQCRSRRELKNLITDNMAPAILDTCQTVAKYTALQKDLQVSIICDI
jgi:serine/threonine-protein kinase ATR